MKKNLKVCLFILFCAAPNILAQIPAKTLIAIVKAEDELRFDQTLEDLMKSADAKTRARAALGAGRIGDERALAGLTSLLENGSSTEVRTMAVFALGEIESAKAADAILGVLKNAQTPDSLRARAVEAAGKIAAANAKDEKSKILGEAILDVLEAEDRRAAKQNREIVLLGLTAALRAKPEETDLIVARFLTNLDPRVRADAANTLSRIRAKNANEQLRAMLLTDNDAVARANAARALGAAEDKDSFNILLESAMTDDDSRVRVSAIRALGSLKDAKAAEKLLERGEKVFADYKKSKFANPNEKSELLEIGTVLGRLLPNTNSEKAMKFLQDVREADDYTSPEIEIAFAQTAPIIYAQRIVKLPENIKVKNWRGSSAIFQGLGEIAKNERNEKNKEILRETNFSLLKFAEGWYFEPEKSSPFENYKLAIPDLLRANTAFNPKNSAGILLPIFQKEKDVIIRATAAELLGDLKANKENVSALIAAFPQTKNDKLNDAALAILDALEKQYKKLPAGDESRTSILKVFQTALESPDYLVRRKTVSILKSLQLTESVPQTFQRVRFPSNNNAPGEFRTVRADYARAVARKNGTVKAVFTTEKGNFTIDLTPEDAPLTVDNFIRLAKSNYFNGLAVHRVVPNFVMQDGDPRGDGNGGPGWQIRDEINMLPYERGAVGMALSGKDTGGSQWFATHAPQPHLDGGYTVFGRVNETDMKTVDNIVRGDKITSVKIIEKSSPLKQVKDRKK
jgi:cyclophilin family peptidyl-prolyl cis-trans isomerase/HEAT repeat protein